MRLGLVAFLVVATSGPAIWGQEFSYECPTVMVPVSPGESAVQFTVRPVIHREVGSTTETQGYSMVVAHDQAALNTLSVTNLLSFTPDFFNANLNGGFWSVGAVYSFAGSLQVSFDPPVQVLEVVYETAPGYLTGQPQLTDLTFSDTFGPTNGVAGPGGVTLPVNFVHGSVSFQSTGFRRGDVNRDAEIDIADSVAALVALFVPDSGSLPCVSAADTNDDGAFDVSDPVYLLAFLFNPGAPAIPEPLNCAPDPTPDALPCALDCP